MINFNTDLADERRDIFKKANNIENEIQGLEVEEYVEGDNIKVSKVKIISEEGEKAIGKPIGTYITIDIKKLKIASDKDIEKASNIVTKELKGLLDKHIQLKEDVLVVGLGNIYVTPDSLRSKSSIRDRYY